MKTVGRLLFAVAILASVSRGLTPLGDVGAVLFVGAVLVALVVVVRQGSRDALPPSEANRPPDWMRRAPAAREWDAGQSESPARRTDRWT